MKILEELFDTVLDLMEKGVIKSEVETLSHPDLDNPELEAGDKIRFSLLDGRSFYVGYIDEWENGEEYAEKDYIGRTYFIEDDPFNGIYQQRDINKIEKILEDVKSLR